MHISTLLPAFLAPLSLATHLLITIPPSTHLVNPSTLPPSTSATLTTLSQKHSAPLRTDNSFDFRNVTSGSYLLDIHSHTHTFSPLRVDVHEGTKEEVSVWGTFRGNEWNNKGEAIVVQKADVGGKNVWNFEAKATAVKDYFVERAGFSPLGILKNPMILIAGVSMLVVFGMPYLMENMDPEMRAEFEERQKSSPLSGGQTANPLQNFDAAAWLAGSSGSGASTPKGAGAEKGVSR